MIADAVETVLCYLGYLGFTDSPPHFRHSNFILNAADLPEVKNAVDMYEYNILIFTVNFSRLAAISSVFIDFETFVQSIRIV